MSYSEVNGVSLYYDEFGSGDNVVICASGGDFKEPDITRWPYYLADYGYHVYTVTLRGHWKSSLVTEDYGKEWYNVWADDVYEFARSLNINQFTYMGWSHGSGVGWHLADRHPESLKCFIAIACGPHYLCGDLNEKQTSFARERVIQAADDPELKLQIAKEREPDWCTIPAERIEKERERYERWFENWMNKSSEEMRIRPRIPFAWIDSEDELVEKLKTINTPMLMIGATEDEIINPKAMFRSACAVPRAKTLFYQGASHRLLLDGPFVDDIRDEILLFLKHRTGGRGPI